MRIYVCTKRVNMSVFICFLFIFEKIFICFEGGLKDDKTIVKEFKHYLAFITKNNNRNS
jgi:hypothetical protein